MLSEARIKEILKESNVKVDNSRGGKNLYCHCPFHEDEKASLIISKENGYWCCFSDKCIISNDKQYKPFEELIKLLKEYNFRK